MPGFIELSGVRAGQDAPPTMGLESGHVLRCPINPRLIGISVKRNGQLQFEVHNSYGALEHGEVDFLRCDEF